MKHMITEVDVYVIRVFLLLGMLYYVLSIVETIKWWNGSDANGNPK